ncbi:MAG: lysophospholipid acyltransferase family protein [Kiritimatiellaeota bacterium]|nr:lysophospholipid acyltransferase family protein [Kiritimatiellota bacterium]
MKKNKNFQHRFEYAALRVLETLVCGLPERVALAVGVGVAGLMHLLGFRKKETARRVREVFGDAIPGRDIRRIARLSLRNMALNAVELMRIRRVNRAWIGAHVLDAETSLARVNALREKHGGLILALPHMGNWDLAGVACERLGIKILAVAARQKNPYVNAWLAERRGAGIHMIERGAGETAREALKLLAEGWVFAILADVRVRRPDVEVDFLGRKANIGRGMAVYAWCGDVPIVPVVCERVGWRRHRFHVLDPLPPPDPSLGKDAAVQLQTQRVMRCFEEQIRARPEQWLWHNKRWVLAPLEKRG